MTLRITIFWLVSLSCGERFRGDEIRVQPLPLERRAIAGTVVDERGQPIAGVHVEAYTPVVGFHSSFSMPTGRDRFPGAERVAVTDDAGRFRIEDLSTDEVQLSLRSTHRHVNDANYPVKEGVLITMRGSGKPGVIQGRLSDATTGKPPAGASEATIVLRHSPQAHLGAGEDGRFTLPTVASMDNKYQVHVYAKGYAAAEAMLTALPEGSTEFVDVNLTERPPLRGRLVDAETEKPIAGARMLYGVDERLRYFAWTDFEKYTDGYHSLSFVQRQTSSESGEFWFAEPQDGRRGVIVVSVDGYRRLILEPDGRRFDDAGELLIRLQKESAFTGIVYKDGVPLANASVHVSRRSDGGMMHMNESVRTDAHGKYRYGRLAAGFYSISGGGYTRRTMVGKGKTATVNLGDDLGPIRIHGKTEPGATVTLQPESDWEYTSFRTKANADGEYEVRGLEPGNYRVRKHSAKFTGFIDPRETVIAVTKNKQRIDLETGPNGIGLAR
jgi:hypothetical protein